MNSCPECHDFASGKTESIERLIKKMFGDYGSLPPIFRRIKGHFADALSEAWDEGIESYRNQL